MNGMNTYTFEKRNLQKNEYDKIFDYVHAHRNDTWKRLELLYLSGYISDKTYDNLVRNPKTYSGYYSISGTYYSYKTSDAASGYLCYLTTRMRELGILTYDKHIRRWSIGPNFDHYYYLNTSKAVDKKEKTKSENRRENIQKSEEETLLDIALNTPNKRKFDFQDFTYENALFTLNIHGSADDESVIVIDFMDAFHDDDMHQLVVSNVDMFAVCMIHLFKASVFELQEMLRDIL